jgi:DNA-binding FadR family transcriptional regulator
MTTKPIPQSLERGKLHMHIVANIEARILSGELQVGERLPSEAEIGRIFGVSTRSVREALQVLETKGLVRRKHGERAEVVRDDVGEFMDSLVTSVGALFAKDANYLVQAMDVRRMIEVDVIGRLAGGENAPGTSVTAALDLMRKAVADNDFGLFTEADAAFHRALVQSLGNEILSSLHGNLHTLIAGVIKVSSRVPRKTLKEGLGEHEKILSLVVAGDIEGARKAMREHIINSTAYLEQAIRKSKGVD